MQVNMHKSHIFACQLYYASANSCSRYSTEDQYEQIRTTVHGADSFMVEIYRDISTLAKEMSDDGYPISTQLTFAACFANIDTRFAHPLLFLDPHPSVSTFAKGDQFQGK